MWEIETENSFLILSLDLRRIWLWMTQQQIRSSLAIVVSDKSWQIWEKDFYGFNNYDENKIN